MRKGVIITALTRLAPHPTEGMRTTLVAFACLAAGANAFLQGPALTPVSVSSRASISLRAPRHAAPLPHARSTLPAGLGLRMAETATGIDTAALTKAANEARGLAMDSIAAAKSGHLGLPLGCAEVSSCFSVAAVCERDKDFGAGLSVVLRVCHGHHTFSSCEEAIYASMQRPRDLSTQFFENPRSSCFWHPKFLDPIVPRLVCPWAPMVQNSCEHASPRLPNKHAQLDLILSARADRCGPLRRLHAVQPQGPAVA
eukprot:991210-Rhodomonas_salina.2